jgi:hypothetical protein
VVTLLARHFYLGLSYFFLRGYFQCNPIQYGGLVLYLWGDIKNFAKFVRGLSADQLAVERISANQ